MEPSPNTSPKPAMLQALERWGGALVAPRRTVAALDIDAGARDGLVLGALYVVGTSIYPMTAAIASVIATHSIVALLSGVARVMLTPIVVLVLTETLLGSGRAYRGGVTLLPLVVVATLAHLLVLLQLPSLPGFWPDIVGAAAAAAYALWIRPAVPRDSTPSKDRPG
jgi:hypothetical protein